MCDVQLPQNIYMSIDPGVDAGTSRLHLEISVKCQKSRLLTLDVHMDVEIFLVGVQWMHVSVL